MTADATTIPDDMLPLADALFACAANPENWDRLIAALDDGPAPAGDGEAAPYVLARAGELAWRLGGGAQSFDPDELPFACIILSSARRVVMANAAARRQLAHVARSLQPDAAPDFHNPDNLERLEHVFRTLQTQMRAIVHFVNGSADGHHFAFAIRQDAFPPQLKPFGGQVALILSDVAVSADLLKIVRDGFGLTPAEMRLVDQIKHGLSIQEAAKALNVSANTARNQLQSAFAKVGVSRQSSLVRSLTQLSLLAARLWPNAAELGDTSLDPALFHDLSHATPPHSFISLPDGRRLAYRDYGGAGRPVLFFHEGMGSSLLPTAFVHEARQCSLRLICAERPGFGLSDPDPDVSFASVAGDMRHLLDMLSIGSVQVSGVLTGATYALAAAAALGPRALRVMLCSGRPPREPLDRRPGGPGLRFRAHLLSNAWLVDTFYEILRARINKPMIARLVRRTAGLSRADTAFLATHPELADFIAAYSRESLAISSKGVTDELRYLSRGEDLDLTGLTAELVAWHGEDDKIAPWRDLRDYLDGRAAEFRVFPDIGHFLMAKYGRQVIQRLAEPV